MGGLKGFARESTWRGEGDGQHEVHFGVSDIFIKCSFVMESEHFSFWTQYSSPPGFKLGQLTISGAGGQ